jgi:hypothetical protein
VIRLLFIALVGYSVFYFIKSFLKPNISSPKNENSSNSKVESDKDWGGKYVDYEEIKDEK